MQSIIANKMSFVRRVENRKWKLKNTHNQARKKRKTLDKNSLKVSNTTARSRPLISSAPKSKTKFCWLLATLLLVVLSTPIATKSTNKLVGPSAAAVCKGNSNIDSSLRRRSKPQQQRQVHVKLGVLLEESNYEQANIFIRSIKMINERHAEILRRMLKTERNSYTQTAEAKSDDLNSNEGKANEKERADLTTVSHKNGNNNNEPAASLTRSTLRRLRRQLANATEHSMAQTQTQTRTRIRTRDRFEALLELNGNSTDTSEYYRHENGSADNKGLHYLRRRLRQQEYYNGSHSRRKRDSSEYFVTHPTLASMGFGPSSSSSSSSWSTMTTKDTSHKQPVSPIGLDDTGRENTRRSIDEEEEDCEDEFDVAQMRTISIELEPVIEFLNDRDSSFEADQKVCQLIESGARAIIGPIEGASIAHVQSICDNLEIPYFELRPFAGTGSGLPVSFAASASLASSGQHRTISRQSAKLKSMQRNAPAPKPIQQLRRSLSATQEEEEEGDYVADNGRDNNNNNSGNKSNSDDNSNNNNNASAGIKNRPPPSSWIELNEADGANDSNNAVAMEPPRTLLHLRATQSMDKAINDATAADSIAFAADTNAAKNYLSELGARNEAKTVAASGGAVKQRPWPHAPEQNVALLPSAVDPPPTEAQLRRHKTPNVLASSERPMRRTQATTTKEKVQIDGTDKRSRLEPEAEAAAKERHERDSSQQQQHQRPPHTNMHLAGTHLPPPPPQLHRIEDLTMNLYPSAQMLNAAYIDLIYALNWTSFAIVYETGNSLIKFQDLFRESSTTATSTNKWHIRLFSYDSSDYSIELAPTQQSSSASSARNGRFRPTRHTQAINCSRASDAESAMDLCDGQRATGSDTAEQADQARPISVITVEAQQRRASTFRDVFWKVKSSGERNIVLDVSRDELRDALKHAQQVGCMTEDFSYIIASLDLHTIDLEDFRYSRTKISAYSLVQVPKSSFQTKSDYASKMETSSKRARSKFRVFPQANASSSSSSASLFDDKYLEQLGIHTIHEQLGQSHSQPENGKHYSERDLFDLGAELPQVQSASSGSISYNEAANNEFFRREVLQSSPASLGLLPTLNRNNEQKLFDFYLSQQERNLTHVRLATSSAILHDSLILYLLALNELEDPSGSSYLLAADDDDDGAADGLDDNGSNSNANNTSNNDKQTIGCSLNSKPWPRGSSLVNYMRRISFNGLTGPISFDQQGLRSNFKLDLMGMAPNFRLVKVGEWHSKLVLDSMERSRYVSARPTTSGSSSLNIQNKQQYFDQTHPTKTTRDTFLESDRAQGRARSYEELSEMYEIELKNYNRLLAQGHQIEVPYDKGVSPSGALLVNEIIFEHLYFKRADQIETLIVTAKLSQPYFMLKETPNKLEGNDQFEGFAVDLIHELSKLVNFKYIWREVADKKYGSKETLPNGTVVWNGMIGEIVRGVADLAIVDLTITAQREEAVDFTLPFMNTGISILFKKPTTKVTTLFSFLSPFSSDVWAYVLAAYCGISAILFLVGHISPYEWADPHPCRHAISEDDAVLRNQFSLLNSFWFTIGSLMQQGSDLTPRSMSTRTIAGIWYFFTLIMISSYTANLAAFLTVEKVVYPIENVQDLSNQQEIKYGCVESGTTCLFFRDSQISTYKKIDETMRNYKTYVRSNDEGQKKVGEGKFAFFMESTTIEYIVERNCNLTQIGGLIDSKGYGLATSKKSRLKRPYRTLLNEGILHLQETGMLHVLKNRWWKERRGGGTCTDDGKGGGVTELSLANVGGVFVVLLGGLGISFLVAVAEFMWKARQSGFSRDNMCEGMMNDLKFALACKSSTKPISRSHTQRSSRAMNQRKLAAAQVRADGPIMRPASSSVATIGRNQAQPLQLAQQSLETAARASSSYMNNRFDPKQCDPILLHAMLTMLMQQQQQTQQTYPLSEPTQTDISSSMHSKGLVATSTDANPCSSQNPPRRRQFVISPATPFATSSAETSINYRPSATAPDKIAQATAAAKYMGAQPGVNGFNGGHGKAIVTSDSVATLDHENHWLTTTSASNNGNDGSNRKQQLLRQHNEHARAHARIGQVRSRYKSPNSTAASNALVSSSNGSSGWSQNGTTTNGSGRRRPLYAQRTIDLADEFNLPS